MNNRELKEIVKHILVYQKNNRGKLPTLNNIARKFEIDINQARNIYRLLVKKGFLKRNRSRYKIEDKEKIKEKIKSKQRNDVVVIIIKIIMAIVGIGAICLSIFYTGIWLDEFLPTPLAYILSCIMIAFSVIAFETMIIFWNNKEYPAIILFSVLWFIVLIFSMISTVAGQYNQRLINTITETKKNVEVTHKKMSYDIYNQEENDILDSIKRKEKELNSFQIMMSDFKTAEDQKNSEWLYWDINEKIKKTNTDIEILRKELKEIRSVKKEFLKKEVKAGVVIDIKKDSFYTWIGGLFNIESRYIEFWMSIFPAIFIDLIAPLAIAVSMFLKRKED
jgi:DNA-binding transcriptional regulator YhcF (GntR family)